MNEKPLIQAIIVDYGSAEDAERLSTQLAGFHGADAPFELRITHWDNGNASPRQASPEQTRLGIQVIRSDTNLGYAGAINAFVEHCKSQSRLGDAVWILNPDLEVTPAALPLLWKALGENPRCAAVGAEVRKGSEAGPVWGTRGGISPWLGITWMEPWRKRGPLPRWSYLPGCSPLIRTQAFLELGGFPTEYFLYFEETEFCVRAQRAGWELWVEPAAKIIHRVDSLKAGVPGPAFAYYFTRGQFLFWKRCFGIPTWVHLPRGLWVVFKEVVLPLRRADLRTAWALIKEPIIAGLVDGVRLYQGRRSFH